MRQFSPAHSFNFHFCRWVRPGGDVGSSGNINSLVDTYRRDLAGMEEQLKDVRPIARTNAQYSET